MSLTRDHILGEKPPPSGYQPHPSDVDSLEDAQELHLTGFAKIATGFEDYIFPPTLNRSAIATLLVDSTPGGMMRTVITCLLATGPLPKTLTISLDWEQEGLSCAAFNVSHTDETTDEPNLATTIAPVVTRNGSGQPTPPASPGKMRPPAPVAPPPQTQVKTQRNPGTRAVITRKGKQRTCRHSPAPQKPKQHPPTAPPEETPPLTPVAPPPRTRTRKRRDQDTLEPMPPTQETATPTDTALSQGEHQGPYPTMVQWIADLFRKPQELMARQREDSHLLGKVQDLNNGGTGGEYVTDDDGLLWYAPPGAILRLAIPRSLVPGVLAFVHSTCGHPGVARTTELTQKKYHWTSLKSDVRDYVLSCGCRRLKRSTSQRVAVTSPLPQTLGSPRDGYPRHGSEVRGWESTPPCCSGPS